MTERDLTERDLAEMLRRIDDDAPLDDRDLAFKARLRDELDDTLGRGGMSRARLETADAEPTSHRWRRLTGAAALAAVALGAVLVVASRSDDSPTSPVATQPPVVASTTVPVLGPNEACVRFRASEASALLTGVLPDDPTREQLGTAVDDLEALIVDAATATDDRLPTLLGRVRDAMREAGLRLRADDRAGAAAALQTARVEFATIAVDGPFEACLDR